MDWLTPRIFFCFIKSQGTKYILQNRQQCMQRAQLWTAHVCIINILPVMQTKLMSFSSVPLEVNNGDKCEWRDEHTNNYLNMGLIDSTRRGDDPMGSHCTSACIARIVCSWPSVFVYTLNAQSVGTVETFHAELIQTKYYNNLTYVTDIISRSSWCNRTVRSRWCRWRPGIGPNSTPMWLRQVDSITQEDDELQDTC